MSKIKPADGEGQQNGAENKVNAGMMRKGDEAEGEENRLRQHEEQRRNAGESKGNVATLVGNGAETDPTPRVPVDDRRGTKSATLSNRGEGAAAARVADASAPDEDGNETKIQGRHQDPPQRQSPTPMPSAATGNARDEADTAANSGAEGSLEPNNPNEVDTPSNVPGTPARESHDGHLASGIVGAVATEGVSPPIHSQSPDAVTQHQHQHQQQPPGTTTSVLGMVPDKEDDDDVKLGRARAPPRRHMLQNYASRDSGAVMLESSPGSKGMSNLLVSSKDKYAISPCEDKQWAVLGLSEDILVRTIRISSHEKYSSLVKEFQVLASQTYPVDEWLDLGVFTAKFVQGEQTFDLPQPAFARYLKFKFLSHYGDEFYCTISQVKVHGSTMLESFQHEWQQSSAEVREVTDFMMKKDAKLSAAAVAASSSNMGMPAAGGGTTSMPVSPGVAPQDQTTVTSGTSGASSVSTAPSSDSSIEHRPHAASAATVPPGSKRSGAVGGASSGAGAVGTATVEDLVRGVPAEMVVPASSSTCSGPTGVDGSCRAEILAADGGSGGGGNVATSAGDVTTLNTEIPTMGGVGGPNDARGAAALTELCDGDNSGENEGRTADLCRFTKDSDVAPGADAPGNGHPAAGIRDDSEDGTKGGEGRPGRRFTRRTTDDEAGTSSGDGAGGGLSSGGLGKDGSRAGEGSPTGETQESRPGADGRPPRKGIIRNTMEAISKAVNRGEGSKKKDRGVAETSQAGAGNKVGSHHQEQGSSGERKLSPASLTSDPVSGSTGEIGSDAALREGMKMRISVGDGGERTATMQAEMILDAADSRARPNDDDGAAGDTAEGKETPSVDIASGSTASSETGAEGSVETSMRRGQRESQERVEQPRRTAESDLLGLEDDNSVNGPDLAATSSSTAERADSNPTGFVARTQADADDEMVVEQLTEDIAGAGNTINTVTVPGDKGGLSLSGMHPGGGSPIQQQDHVYRHEQPAEGRRASVGGQAARTDTDTISVSSSASLASSQSGFVSSGGGGGSGAHPTVASIVSTVQGATEGGQQGLEPVVHYEELNAAALAAACLDRLSFSEFREEVLARTHQAQQSAGGGVAIGGQYESIFKTLMNKIKTLEINQSLFSLYIDDVHGCYQEVIRQMLHEQERARASRAELFNAQAAHLMRIGDQWPSFHELQARMVEVENRMLLSSMAWFTSLLCLSFMVFGCCFKVFRRCASSGNVPGFPPSGRHRQGFEKRGPQGIGSKGNLDHEHGDCATCVMGDSAEDAAALFSSDGSASVSMSGLEWPVGGGSGDGVRDDDNESVSCEDGGGSRSPQMGFSNWTAAARAGEVPEREEGN